MDIYDRLDNYCQYIADDDTNAGKCGLWRDSGPFCTNEELSRTFAPNDVAKFITGSENIDDYVRARHVVDENFNVACGVRLHTVKNIVTAPNSTWFQAIAPNTPQNNSH